MRPAIEEPLNASDVSQIPKLMELKGWCVVSEPILVAMFLPHLKSLGPLLPTINIWGFFTLPFPDAFSMNF